MAESRAGSGAAGSTRWKPRSTAEALTSAGCSTGEVEAARRVAEDLAREKPWCRLPPNRAPRRRSAKASTDGKGWCASSMTGGSTSTPTPSPRHAPDRPPKTRSSPAATTGQKTGRCSPRWSRPARHKSGGVLHRRVDQARQQGPTIDSPNSRLGPRPPKSADRQLPITTALKPRYGRGRLDEKKRCPLIQTDGRSVHKLGKPGTSDSCFQNDSFYDKLSA